ncbi:transposase [Mesorhizobium sp. AR07]|uniref:transposase n=1 Tax=Mesorhizobium sp. AR07 TaxID=2865838 RepID=UPI00215F3F9D|nr:transposase [Mesorhizobium sp. AR07]
MTLEHARGDMVAELSGAAATEELTTVRGRVRQRRLWSCTEKRALVDLASAVGSSVTEVAEAFGVAPSQLYAWRKQMAGGELEADQAMATFARIDGKRCAKAPCKMPMNMEFSSHDIGTCKGRYGRRVKRRRGDRRAYNGARARAATKAVELH